MPENTIPATDEAISATAVVDQVDDPTILLITPQGQIVRQIPKERLSFNILIQYQAKAASAMKQAKGGVREIDQNRFESATHWLMMQLFTVNDQPLRITNLTETPQTNPDCLGWDALKEMNRIATELVGEQPAEGKD